jgi:ribosome-binding factor A
MSHRNEQLGSEIAKAVQASLARGLNDPRIRGMITVTRVEVTEDRRNAKIYVSVMPDEHIDLTIHGLKAATGHIRKQAMNRVRSRFFPAIEFRHDAALKEQQAVLSAIARAAAERIDEGREESPSSEAGTDTGDGAA